MKKITKTQSTKVGQNVERATKKGAQRDIGIDTMDDRPVIKKPSPSPPDPEVTEKQPRRKFTVKYKLKILEEADACTQPGQIGLLLRREGLYSSHLTTWKRQKEQGILNAMRPKKRGRKVKEKNPLAAENATLQKENRILQNNLKQAELIIEAQKKISDILSFTQKLTEIERRSS